MAKRMALYGFLATGLLIIKKGAERSLSRTIFMIAPSPITVKENPGIVNFFRPSAPTASVHQFLSEARVALQTTRIYKNTGF